ncbi:DUF3010 family protein [Shewanella corallii]|uniref:DUF3010 family protein n=1 Tax=Shewanella corallii TaxID=560080 RepID=A0ABT0ND53_9GAMM|nr:DUF3010 family protein [Shewanella corallii]MCL2915751.1 DUF3010 family protein [Shewanella corallii]
MRICGVELKGGEAIICLLSQDGDTFNIPDCRKQSFQVSHAETTESMVDFHFAFKKLVEDYKVDEVALIAREQKGKFAGSAVSFKLEAAIQLCDLPVTLIAPHDVKAQLKRNPPQVDFVGLELKKFQQPAFEVAFALQMKKIFGKS